MIFETSCDSHERIRQATKKEARTQRKYYHDRSNMTRFHDGQKVWLYWPRPPLCQQFKKLTRLWTGPWKIVLFKSPVVVELRHVSNGAMQVVHVDRLLPCVSLPAIGDETDNESDTDNQLPKLRYQMRSFRMSPGCLKKACFLSCKNLRPWIHKNPIFNSWTLRTRVLRPPGGPLWFGSSQRLWSHISLAETLRPDTQKQLFRHKNSDSYTKNSNTKIPIVIYQNSDIVIVGTTFS